MNKQKTNTEIAPVVYPDNGSRVGIPALFGFDNHRIVLGG